MGMRPVLLLALLLAAPAEARERKPFLVESTGQSFARLQDAVDSVGDGEARIVIAPGTYRDCAVQESGRIAFVALQPGSVLFDGGICEGKATLVLRGRGAQVEGLAFRGTFVEDGNGAGIRIEQGDLVVVSSRFSDAQSGILSAGDPRSTIAIDRSTFSGLGKHPDGSGAHSLYVNGYGALRVTNSRFERGMGGHYLKSRAPRIEVLNTSFDDSRGRNTNYMIDLSNGAVGLIAGNVFVNGRDKDNYGTLIAVAPEGSEQPSAGLRIENNSVSVVPGYSFETAFVGSWTREPLAIRGNQIAKAIVPVARR
jgi:hypothetical protein